jgi:hypothetical protein
LPVEIGQKSGSMDQKGGAMQHDRMNSACFSQKFSTCAASRNARRLGMRCASRSLEVMARSEPA